MEVIADCMVLFAGIKKKMDFKKQKNLVVLKIMGTNAPVVELS
jgi:hypothetical protein